MIFGSISYLNLLPFQIYMKRRFGSTQFKQMTRWRRAVPSHINAQFARGYIDAAFISSVESAGCRCADLGIVADGAVQSVFLIQGEEMEDKESSSSNALAKALGMRGTVLIGDKALLYRLSGGEGTDLAQEWKRRTGLPFVFARLCFNPAGSSVRKIAAGFLSVNPKIPVYILKKAAHEAGLSESELKWYLGHIGYRIGWREKRSLDLFLKMTRRRGRRALRHRPPLTGGRAR